MKINGNYYYNIFCDDFILTPSTPTINMADSTPGPGNTPGAPAARNPVIYICGGLHALYL